MAKKYVAKPDTWFVAGTVCELVDDYSPQMTCGLFRGLRKCENPASEGGHPLGEVREDEEVCSFDEFDVVEE
jgi:hypothetical protein